MAEPINTQGSKQKSNRCKICRVKVGLLGYSCRCSPNKYFCGKHRLPENHDCSIDFTLEKSSLVKKLPRIVNDKVIKI